jgi:bacillithiol biosynthesis cysteine-adding enzyme BshC
MTRLFEDFCAGASTVRPFYGSLPGGSHWQQRPALPAHWPELVRQLAEQNPAASASAALASLGQGAGTVVTGQQVTLFGGPLFTPFKAATAVARARRASAAGRPHVAIFWLATEDHDFQEIGQVNFPARRELRKLVYSHAPSIARPVGGVEIDASIKPLIEQAGELLGWSEALEALTEAYKPGRTFAQAFADFYSRVFAAQGLLMLDAGGHAFHRMGAPVLRAAVERADELHAALIERDRALGAAGYHAQVAVTPQSSLLFLIDAQTGARMALKRQPPSAQEPQGLWQAGRQSMTTADLLGILDAEPERISPSALLRPVFQDYLLSTSAIIGGPAEIAYFAQSEVLYQRILGRATPAMPRFSATLIEPAIAELLHKQGLTVESLWHEDADSLAQLLANHSLPAEGRERLDAAGTALDGELNSLLEWMRSMDDGLGRSAATAASKMRYQMNRLRRLAANYRLQREASLRRQAETLSQALYPHRHLQERVHGAAYYLARYGFELAERIAVEAENSPAGHAVVWL